MRLFVVLCVLAGFMPLATPSLAHELQAGPGKPKHGGQYLEYNTHYGIELITRADKLIFHMTDHLQPKDMSGSVFKVFVQSKNGTNSYKAIAKETTLVVALSEPVPVGAKIVLTGKDGDGQTIQARLIRK